MERTLTALDRILVDAQNALATVFGGVHAERPNPGAGEAEVVLDESERRHAAGLMRIWSKSSSCLNARRQHWARPAAISA